MSVWDYIIESQAAGKIIVMETCMDGCTFARRATQQVIYIKFLESYPIMSSETSSWRSEMTLASDVSIVAGRECIWYYLPLGWEDATDTPVNEFRAE